MICGRTLRFGTLFLLLLLVSAASAQITFTTIDVPGAGVTGVQGVNTAGDMVGVYSKTNTSPAHAFVLRDGKLTQFTYPGQRSTFAMGINDSGLIVGYTGDVVVRGFVYDGTTYTLLKAGNNSATFSMGINNAGDVVGAVGSIYVTQGFALLYDRFKKLSPPGDYNYVYATGVNSVGEVVGWTAAGNALHGFERSHGGFQDIDFPGAGETEAWGINDDGVVVVWYEVAGGCACGFALKDGKYLSFAYPGAVGTFPHAINALGQAVGSYTLDYVTYHGFVTSPITAADFDSSNCCNVTSMEIRH